MVCGTPGKMVASTWLYTATSDAPAYMGRFEAPRT